MHTPGKRHISPLSRLLAVIGTLFIVIVIVTSPVGIEIDHLLLDFFFLTRGEIAPPEDIVIVAIDEQSFAETKSPWPWPRSMHAQLTKKLSDAGAKVIAYDILFSEPGEEQDDKQFAKAVSTNSRIILASSLDIVDDSKFHKEMLIFPTAALGLKESKTGVVNLPVEPDGFVRKFPINVKGLPSFSFVITSLFSETTPTVTRSSKYLNFYGPPRTIKTVSYYQALDPEKYLPPRIFNNKIVIIGFSIKNILNQTHMASDHYPVSFTRLNNQFMAGAEIQATAAANLLNNNFIRIVPFHWVIISGLLLGLIGHLILAKLRPLKQTMACVAFLMTSSLICFFLFKNSFVFLFSSAFFMPFLAVSLTNIIIFYWNVKQEKNFIKNVFSAYLAPSVVQKIMTEPEMLELRGQSVNASILFTDFTNFTPYTEKTPSSVLISILNKYLGKFSDIVMANQGMVVQYIGDALMAAWGTPVPQKNHAVNACHTALQICSAAADLSMDHLIKQHGSLEIRVGVNSGSMIAGNVGGEKHQSYSILGNAVNLASRLEGLNKIYGTKIIVGEETTSLAKDIFIFRELDLVQVKGKTTVERVFELQSTVKDATDKQLRINKLYAESLELYKNRKWKLASELFHKIYAIEGQDNPSMVMAKRCVLFMDSPPGPDWQGEFIMRGK